MCALCGDRERGCEIIFVRKISFDWNKNFLFSRIITGPLAGIVFPVVGPLKKKNSPQQKEYDKKISNDSDEHNNRVEKAEEIMRRRRRWWEFHPIFIDLKQVVFVE